MFVFYFAYFLIKICQKLCTLMYFWYATYSLYRYLVMSEGTTQNGILSVRYSSITHFIKPSLTLKIKSRSSAIEQFERAMCPALNTVPGTYRYIGITWGVAIIYSFDKAFLIAVPQQKYPSWCLKRWALCAIAHLMRRQDIRSVQPSVLPYLLIHR